MPRLVTTTPSLTIIAIIHRFSHLDQASVRLFALPRHPCVCPRDLCCPLSVPNLRPMTTATLPFLASAPGVALRVSRAAYHLPTELEMG